MKKFFALLIALTMVLSLAACGKNSETPGNSPKVGKGGSGIAIGDITVDNWQQVIKDNFDLDLTLPEGWTVTKTVSLAGAHVYFSCKVDKAEADAFLESVFSELKRVASGDITGHYDNAPYNSIEEANAGGLVDAFNLPVNADGSKKIYFSFSKDTGYDDKTLEPYIEAVSIYLSQKGKWE